ncbi:CD1871A family CXXC motif-containing protein [Clostridium brassicae]|uniref:CD1871A family CXXC motif-containing protein n=1 Tax=Clostridium brassicae TaxID=2999072 RepID=A0ABT4DAI3_9CLOT|nr:CD1871A family CXXC motif-containing protein [Clostridium brassicae]MCY6958668.1 CD1871A family CXXC motif-containing protein [Clostridium brassicae]
MGKRKVVTYGILLGSICLMGVGIYRNEVNTVLKKAVNICLECIGIG